jgi:hypothetical protein
MYVGTSWETFNYAATQELPSNSWNPKFRNCVHKRLPLITILSQINVVHTTPSYFSKIHFNLIHPLCLAFPSGVFLSVFSTSILYAFLFSLFVLYSLPISSSWTLLFWLYLANSPHYAVFSNLLSLHLSWSKYSSQHPLLKHSQSTFLT